MRKKEERKMVEVKRVAEEWKIWDKEEKAARLEEKARKLVLEKFHQWIKIFRKKQSERMLTRKVWDYVIEMKEEFVPGRCIRYQERKEKR